MSTSQEQVNLPGRLGDSARVMKTDPRVDPRLIAALAPFGMDGAPPETPVRLESSLQAKLDYLASTEQAMGGVFASFFNNLPAITNVERRTEVVLGRDGNEIKLFIHRPRNASGALPCVYHLHGGGMVMMRRLVSPRITFSSA